jgi:hypothetical protein
MTSGLLGFYWIGGVVRSLLHRLTATIGVKTGKLRILGKVKTRTKLSTRDCSSLNSSSTL